MVTSSAPLVRTPEEDGGTGATPAAAAAGAPAAQQPQELAVCKVHGRRRIVAYLAECEDGTFACAGDNECRVPTAHLRGPRVVNWYYCECCLFVLNSLRQYALHTRGGRHQHKVRALSEAYAKAGRVFEAPAARVVPEGSERAAVLRMPPPPRVAEMHTLAAAVFPRIFQRRQREAASDDGGTAGAAPDLRRVGSGGGTSRSARKRQRRRRENEQRAADRLREAEDQAATTAGQGSSGATLAESSCESVRVVDLATLDASGDVIFELDACAAGDAGLRQEEPAACRTGTAPVLCPDYDSSSPTSTLFSLSEVGARRAQSARCLLSDLAAAFEDGDCEEDDVHCASASAPSLLAKARGQRAAGSVVAPSLAEPAAPAPTLQMPPQQVRVSYHSLIANSLLLENPARSDR